METKYYPPDHELGMKVPKGGANCAKCKYVVISKENPKCDNHGFREWNKGEYLPHPPEVYCCDLFEAE